MAERTKTIDTETPTATPPAETERPVSTLAVSGLALSKAQLMDALLAGEWPSHKQHLGNGQDLRRLAEVPKATLRSTTSRLVRGVFEAC